MPSSPSARLGRALPRVRLARFTRLTRLTRRRVSRRRVVAGSVVLVLLVGLVAWAVWPTPASYHVQDRMITVKTGPGGDQDVTLDTRLYLPKSATASHPVPAVLLAHGFGGTKLSVQSNAKDL